MSAQLTAVDRPTALLQQQSIGGWGNESHGLKYDPFSRFSNPLGQKQTGLYDPNTNFNTGVTTSNNNYIVLHWYQKFTLRFPKESIHIGMPFFLVRDTADISYGFRTQYEFASIYELNRWLAGPEGRQRYGRDKTCQRLLDDFGFCGSYNTEIAGNVDGSYVASAVTGRNARMDDFTRMYHREGDQLGSHILESVYLLCIKLLTPQVNQGFSEKQETEEEYLDRQYWSFPAFKSMGNQPPHPIVYNNSIGKGTVIHMGYIWDFHPANKFDVADMKRARDAMDGYKNIEERNYLKQTIHMKNVNIMLGMQ